MKGIIYKHTCPNGKSYIGQTYRSVEERWSNGSGYYNIKYFNNAIRKYGWENIKHEILVEIEFEDIDELNQLEEDYIIKENTLYPNGYNLQTVGKNHVRTDEYRKHLSEANKGKKMSSENRQKTRIRVKKEWADGLRNADHLHTPECIKKRSITFKERSCNIGEKNGMYGKIPYNKGVPMSEEQKEILRLAHIGRKTTPESKKKCSKTMSNLVWINNGKVNYRINKEAELPEGFKYGRFLGENVLEKFRTNAKKQFLGENSFFYGKHYWGSDNPNYKRVDKEIIDNICNNFTHLKDGLAHYNISLYVFNQRYKEYYGSKFKDRNKKLKYLGFKEEKDADEFKEE